MKQYKDNIPLFGWICIIMLLAMAGMAMYITIM